jgi:hypothetical protein
MKKSGKAILLVGALFVVLAVLNFFFFAGDRQTQENEANGNRSTFAPTPFGTSAYYSLLEESGYPVTRLVKPYTSLKDSGDVGTLVIISLPAASNPDADEISALNKWIQAGGFLIIIDREIELEFPGNVQVHTTSAYISSPVRPVQPTSLAKGVRRLSVSNPSSYVTVGGNSAVVDFADNLGAVVADTKVGNGRVMFITEPHIVANNGIEEDDNLALALNILEDRPSAKKIAFDEYHHGYGTGGFFGNNSLLGYFKGTPVPWIMAQCVLISLLLIYTRGRRFARPIPLKVERRTTNLEFVSSMATIARLARASGLAMENIYSEFRRRLCHYAGVGRDIDSPRLAREVASRSRINERDLRDVMARSERIIRGGRASDSELLNLVTRIRDIESDLKLWEPLR